MSVYRTIGPLVFHSKDLDSLVPLTVRGLPTYKPQHWLNRIHDELKGTVLRRTPPECMAKFVGRCKVKP